MNVSEPELFLPGLKFISFILFLKIDHSIIRLCSDISNYIYLTEDS